MNESNAIQIIKDPNDPLNLKIIFDNEIFGTNIEFELIHNIEKNQIDSKLVYNEEVWFSECFDLKKIKEKAHELIEKYEQNAVFGIISVELLLYYESNFDAIATIRGWKKRKR